MAAREKMEQTISSTKALAVRPSGFAIAERSPIAGIFDAAIFLSTLLVSLAAIIAVAVATPFVVLFAAIAEFFDKDGTGSAGRPRRSLKALVSIFFYFVGYSLLPLIMAE